MKQITKEQWLEALLAIQQGSRLNQLLSVMSGGTIQYVAWLDTASFASLDGAEQGRVFAADAGAGTGGKLLASSVGSNGRVLAFCMIRLATRAYWW